MPLFLIALFIIHPWLGLVGLVGAAALLCLAYWNDRSTRESMQIAIEAANGGYQFTDAIARHAGPVRAMGMSNALAVRWHVDRETMVRRQAEASDRNAGASALIRTLRIALQCAMIASAAGSRSAASCCRRASSRRACCSAGARSP